MLSGLLLLNTFKPLCNDFLTINPLFKKTFMCLATLFINKVALGLIAIKREYQQQPLNNEHKKQRYVEAGQLWLHLFCRLMIEFVPLRIRVRLIIMWDNYADL